MNNIGTSAIYQRGHNYKGNKGSYWYLTKISSTQPSTKASNGKLGLLSPQYWYKEDSFNPLTHIVLAMSWVIPLGVGQEYEVLVTTAMRIVRR
jgi:hypothetical protein